MLTTKRLTLRAMTAADLEDFARVVTQSPERPDRDPRQTWLAAEAGFAARELISWAIACEGSMAGTIGFYRGFKDDVGEIGYMLQRSFQRRGILTETLPAVLAHAYESLGLRMVVAYTEDANEPSLRLLRRQGFIRTETVDGKYRRWEHVPLARTCTRRPDADFRPEFLGS